MTILILGSNVTSESLCKTYSPCLFGRDWKGWSEGKRHDLSGCSGERFSSYQDPIADFIWEGPAIPWSFWELYPCFPGAPSTGRPFWSFCTHVSHWSPTRRDTTSAKVPRAHLVSGSGSRLPWWSVQTFCPMLFAWFEADFISLNMIFKENLCNKMP